MFQIGQRIKKVRGSDVGMVACYAGHAEGFAPPNVLPGLLLTGYWGVAFFDAPWTSNLGVRWPASQHGYIQPDQWEPLVDDLIKSEVQTKALIVV